MKRRTAPPLYELIRSRSGERAAAPRDVDESPEPGEPLVERWLRPGRAVQMPVGYLFVAGALVLLLLMLAFMFGHSRGYERARYIQADEFESVHMVDESRRPIDPLGQPTTAGAALPRPEQPRTSNAASPSQTQPRPTPAGAGARQWGPIESDPRQAGFNYFVLATTNPDGARRLAEFCRERGLETYVVSGNNVRLRRVIALPGFEAGQRNSETTRAVENLIHRIGESWKNSEPGATDLRDAYPDRYGR